MRTRRTIFFLVVIACAIAGCTQRHTDVVVIEKTKSYHMPECPRVNMADTKVMPVAEARARTMHPCKGCKPDMHIK